MGHIGRAFASSAHRNRSDLCDLRLRCPSRTSRNLRAGFRQNGFFADFYFNPPNFTQQKSSNTFLLIGRGKKSLAISRQGTAMLHCDLRVRWKIASDLRFRAAISESETASFCGTSGDLAPSTRKSLRLRLCDFGALSLPASIIKPLSSTHSGFSSTLNPKSIDFLSEPGLGRRIIGTIDPKSSQYKFKIRVSQRLQI